MVDGEPRECIRIKLHGQMKANLLLGHTIADGSHLDIWFS